MWIENEDLDQIRKQGLDVQNRTRRDAVQSWRFFNVNSLGKQFFTITQRQY